MNLRDLPERRRNAGRSSERCYALKTLPLCLAVTMLFTLGGAAQTIQRGTSQRAEGSKTQSQLQRDYEAAQNFQAAGKLEAAAVEYRQFLGQALHRIALGRSNTGELTSAVPMLADALNLVPSSVDIRVDYAEACRRTGDLRKAKSLAQDAITAEPGNFAAHLTLGRVLSEMGQHPAAIEQFEAAVGIHPDFEDTYALGNEYLRAKDLAKAEKIFAGILEASSNSPAVQITVGTAYAERGYPQQAIAAFKKVIAKHPNYPGAHYSLGAAYLVGASDAMYPQAAAQFRQELRLNPNDYLSHYQLGYIELSQHKLNEAEADLKRATQLDPTDPDAFLSLGQLYMEMNRTAQAEAMLRKSIALTTEVTRNHYQVQRAHYMLARLLLETGHAEEGKAEMQISQELLRKSVLENQGRGMNPPHATPPAPEAPASRQQAKEVADFEKQIAPAIADSYNNLGAIAAGQNHLDEALEYFEKAHAWNPSLPGLDLNWGKAAFGAYRFGEAIGPLGRYLQGHPGDTGARSALATSFFMLDNYAEVVKTWAPDQAQVAASPQFGYMYGVSLVRTGQYDRGVALLKNLEAKAPKFAPIHEALGETFSAHNDFKDAVAEFRQVVRLSPADFGARYNLALALVGNQKNDEAEAVLIELAKSWQDPHVFYTLGKLELERGEVSGAIASLEKAAALSPKSGPIHHELADAYRRAARTEDADREMKLYQALQSAAAKAPEKEKPE